jgi:pyrimidine-specific ribonucleoside hydrolase
MRSLIVMAGLTCLAGAQPRIPVWIDTDPSVAPGGHEVDDGIALLQAFASPELDIRGISIVFGNTDLVNAGRIGRELTSKFAPRKIAVFNGAGGPGELGTESDASKALARELRRTRLTVLALGPATNVATVVRNYPELAERIDQVIAVAGRRPGQRFRAGPSQEIPFRDLNFELDPEAFRILLASPVRLVLAPWEISSGVWLNETDLQAAAANNPGMRWLMPAAKDWLALWRREFGARGFNPFDTLAVGYLTDRLHLECDRLHADIETAPDDTAVSPSPPLKPYLLVSRPGRTERANVSYCFAARPEFKPQLVRRLSQQQR